MKLSLSLCTRQDLGHFISLVDSEFLQNRDRSLSLSRRFPSLFTFPGDGELVLAKTNSFAVGALAIRHFNWISDRVAFRAGMLGMVCVSPSVKGQGIGSRMVQFAIDAASAKRLDFLVLWTQIPSFYERFGFCAHDRGLFGEVIKYGQKSPFRAPCIPCCLADVSSLESIRAHRLKHRSLRSPLDYYAIPLTVNDVTCFQGTDPHSQGYALVGELQHTAYVYEMVGSSRAYEAIWNSIIERYKKVYVNEMSDSEVVSWLATRAEVCWREQNHTLWYPISERTRGQALSEWHIPYFDRI